ncbi:hypothetical protein D3C87_339380 [compost metagenome]
MKQVGLAVMIVFSAQFSMAQGRAMLCRTWYTSEVFTGYLNVSISEPAVAGTAKILWADTHIPYGIRPLGYEITSLQCTPDGLRAYATSPQVDVDLSFVSSEDTPDYQPGKLTYIRNGEAGATRKLECSIAAVKAFCATQNP